MSTKATSEPKPGPVVMLDPSVVLADPTQNSRYSLKPSRIKELAASIVERGRILENLEVEPLVPPQGKKAYRLTMGFYRHAAAELLNKDGAGVMLPCTVVTYENELDRLKTQLAENVERESQSPIDMSVAAQKLMAAGMPKPELRKHFRRPGRKEAVSNSWLNQVVELTTLDKKVQKRIHDGEIQIAGAFELLRCKPEKRDDVISRLDKDRAAQIEKEEKEEAAYLKVEADAQAAEQKRLDAEKAKLDAEEAKAAKLKEAEDAKIAAAEALKAAGADVATNPEAATKVAEAAKALKAADEKLKKLAEKAQSAAKHAAERAKVLKAEREKKSKAGKTKDKAVGPKEVKKAAIKEGAAKGLVPLKRPEIMEVIQELTLPNGDSEKIQMIARAFQSCFNGEMTPDALFKSLKKTLGIKG